MKPVGRRTAGSISLRWHSSVNGAVIRLAPLSLSVFASAVHIMKEARGHVPQDCGNVDCTSTTFHTSASDYSGRR
jgi:hypothetical protein